MKKFLLACILLAAVPAQADETISCNPHGAMVTLANGTILYLGKTCDAAEEGGGTGAWWNAASFLAVEIDGKMYAVAKGSGIDCLPFCKTPL